MLGVEQQVADRFVLLAKLGRDRRKQLVVELDIGLGRGGLRRAPVLRLRRGCGLPGPADAGLRPRKLTSLVIEVVSPAPMRPAEATLESLAC